MLWFNDVKTVLWMLLSLLFHELGHLTAARLQGRRVTAFSVDAGGMRLQVDTVPFSYMQDALLHLCGPLFNLLLACFCFCLIRMHPTELSFFAFYFNLSLFLFHSLPLSSLDGGAALYALLCRRGEPDEAHRRALTVSHVVSFLSVLFLLFLLRKIGFHASLVFGLLFFLGDLPRRKKVPAL
ncbi:MAG: M50 family metallopeptidase [Clostridia bacterium]|nr:M50 family metallopeptidase [Clostridia bacterium]